MNEKQIEMFEMAAEKDLTPGNDVRQIGRGKAGIVLSMKEMAGEMMFEVHFDDGSGSGIFKANEIEAVGGSQ